MESDCEIRELKEEIDREIEKFFDSKIREANLANMPVEFLEAVENVRSFILRGGKRLRPILFCYGYAAAKGDSSRDIVRSSILMELMHAYLLIHDDIIDQDDRRHGGFSMHNKYESDYAEKFPGARDLGHFGVAMAINVGDIVSSWSYEVLANADFPDERKKRALGKMAQIGEETLTGQMLDELLEMGDSFEEDLIKRVYNYKTARYTIRGPLQIGAILAGAERDELEFISNFSIPLGIAYQIQDDILGMFGKEENIGKPVGSDLREGKKTLLVSYALGNSPERERSFLLSVLGKKDLAEDEIEKARELMKRTGALDYSNRTIGELMEEFKKKLKSDPERLSLRYESLEGFANKLIDREK